MNLFPKVWLPEDTRRWFERYVNSPKLERHANTSHIDNWKIPTITITASGEAITTEAGIDITTESGDTLVTE